jgi:ankyrin repeat protein
VSFLIHLKSSVICYLILQFISDGDIHFNARYLFEQGAEFDTLGRDLVATPMHWAARYGHLYVIQLLIPHDADLTRMTGLAPFVSSVSPTQG